MKNPVHLKITEGPLTSGPKTCMCGELLLRPETVAMWDDVAMENPLDISALNFAKVCKTCKLEYRVHISTGITTLYGLRERREEQNANES